MVPLSHGAFPGEVVLDALECLFVVVLSELEEPAYQVVDGVVVHLSVFVELCVKSVNLNLEMLEFFVLLYW